MLPAYILAHPCVHLYRTCRRSREAGCCCASRCESAACAGAFWANSWCKEARDHLSAKDEDAMTPHERKEPWRQPPSSIAQWQKLPPTNLRCHHHLRGGNGLVVAERGRDERGRGHSLACASSSAGSAAGASQQAASAGCVPRAARQADPLPDERFVVVLQRRVVLPERPSLKTRDRALERRGGRD